MPTLYPQLLSGEQSRHPHRLYSLALKHSLRRYMLQDFQNHKAESPRVISQSVRTPSSPRILRLVTSVEDSAGTFDGNGVLSLGTAFAGIEQGQSQ
jgi:hypothetical protein